MISVLLPLPPCYFTLLIPWAVGYPAVIKVTKAASPFSLAASKAASILPPTPRSMSATEIESAEATPKLVLRFSCRCTLCVFPRAAATPRPKVVGVDSEEKARVEDAAQPNQSEKDVRRILGVVWSKVLAERNGADTMRHNATKAEKASGELLA